ncbi:MAG: hypothetical protein LUE08_07070 [Akkermansiaceae bacterium]|nr:hypothetical protein [Akkermansiaceae bacterium]
MKINRNELINTIDELIESNGWDDGQGRIYVDADGEIYGYPPGLPGAWEIANLSHWSTDYEVKDLRDGEWVADEILSDGWTDNGDGTWTLEEAED